MNYQYNSNELSFIRTTDTGSAVTVTYQPTDSVPSIQPGTRNSEQGTPTPPAVFFRSYQREAFENKIHGLEVWLWGRQTGKSFTLAAWAVDRLLNNPGRLVTILSNSKSNGMELNLKCAEVCRLFQIAYEQLDLSDSDPVVDGPQSQIRIPNSKFASSFSSFPSVEHPNQKSEIKNQKFSRLAFEYYHYETRITINGVTGRIKVLPANPRTARGFSGDLILDEFAFHENSAAIWEAAEPILSAHPDYLCRVASTPNGRHNMFYRLATDPKIPLRRVTRSDAFKQGLQIFHPITREPITPDQARELAMDKHAYDQNYECIFESENMALLTYDLISQAERPNIGFICQHDWSFPCIDFLSNPKSHHGSVHHDNLSTGTHLVAALGTQIQIPNENPSQTYSSDSDPSCSSFPSVQSESQIKIPNPELYVGVDVGRSRDLTVITVLEKSGQSLFIRAILRLSDMRLPEQQERLAVICRLPGFRGACIDMTGLGLGLYEYTQKQFGYRIRGINFASSLPISNTLVNRNSLCGIPNPKSQMPNTAHAPEVLALGLLAAYEDRRIQHPIDEQLREDLRKPERLVSSSGRVSIAATRDGAGHADHFWSMALAVHAAQGQPDIYIHVVKRKNPFMWIDKKRLMG